MGLFGRKKINKDDKIKEKNGETGQSGKEIKIEEKKETEEQEKKSMKDLYSDVDKAKKVKKSEKKGKAKHGNAYKILIKPLVTEKVTNLGSESKYVFEVDKRANKIEVAKAVEEIYGIRPVKVNMINMAGKSARYGKVTGKRKNWKKTIVTLPKGESIKVYEGV